MDALVVVKDATGWLGDSEGVYLCPDCQKGVEVDGWFACSPDFEVVCEACDKATGTPSDGLLIRRLEQAVRAVVDAPTKVAVRDLRMVYAEWQQWQYGSDNDD